MMSFLNCSEYHKAIDANDNTKALCILNDAVTDEPTNLSPLMLRASLFLGEHRYKEALTDLMTAKSLGQQEHHGEMVSCGIYHSLVGLGYFNRAIEEANLFFGSPPVSSKSHLYFKAFQDLVKLRKHQSDEDIIDFRRKSGVCGDFRTAEVACSPPSDLRVFGRMCF